MPIDRLSIDRILATVDNQFATVNNQFDSSFLKDELFERYGSDSDNIDEEFPPPPPLLVDSFSRRRDDCNQALFRKEVDSLLRQKRIRWVFQKLEQNRQCVMRYHRSKRISVRFHHCVVLLKHFFKWRNHVKSRKLFLSSRRNLLRKILLKWKSHAEESSHQRIATYYIVRTVDAIRFRVVGLAVNIWKNWCWQKRLVKKIFSAWRSRTELSLQKKHNLEIRIMARERRFYFDEWKSHIQLVWYQNTRRWILIKRVMEKWKNVTDENLITRQLKMRQAESFDEERSFKRLSRIFNHIRIYSHKKNQYRMACVRTINGYRNRLKRLAIKQWIVYWKLVRKFRKVIFIVIKRHSLLRWKKVVRKKIKYEATLAKIILNRWNLLAAAASERRSLNLMALNHWACHSCRVVLKSWLSIAVRDNGRIRTPRPRPGGTCKYGDVSFRRRRRPSRGPLDRLNYDIKPIRRPLQLEEPKKRMFGRGIPATAFGQRSNMNGNRQFDASIDRSSSVAALDQSSRMNFNASPTATSIDMGIPTTAFGERSRMNFKKILSLQEGEQYCNKGGYGFGPGRKRSDNDVRLETLVGVQRPDWVLKALAERERAQDETRDYEMRNVDPFHPPPSSLRSHSMRQAEAKCSSTSPSNGGNDCAIKSSGRSDRKLGHYMSIPSRNEIKSSGRHAKQSIWLDKK